jgi:hypothetical protein
MLIGIERELGPVDMLAGFAVFFGAVIIGWREDSWLTGIAIWMGGCLLWCVVVLSVLSCLLPGDALVAITFARAEFELRYPTDRITSTAVRAVEHERFVISIWYEDVLKAMPPLRRYFAVSRNWPPVVTELDGRDWRPRGLK